MLCHLLTRILDLCTSAPKVRENILLPHTREFWIMYSTSLENKCRTIFIWTNVDKRDLEEVSEAIWPLKVRFESSVTPRSLTEVKSTRSCPKKGTVKSLGNLEISCLTPNRTNLVFSELIKRWLAHHHSETCLRSSTTWRRHESMSFDANEKYTLVSST